MQATQNKIVSLIKQLEQQIPDSSQALLAELKQEIENLISFDIENENSPSLPQLDPQSGCYRITDDSNFYCPNCYDRVKLLVQTQRLNRKLRVCSQCRSSIKAA